MQRMVGDWRKETTLRARRASIRGVEKLRRVYAMNCHIGSIPSTLLKMTDTERKNEETLVLCISSSSVEEG